MDSLDRMQLGPLDEPPNEGSSQSTIAIPLRYIYMKMRRIISADFLDGAEVGNVIKVAERYWIFYAASEIPNGTPIGIKGEKKATAVFFNVPAERHLSKRLSFFLTAKITSSARCEKNVVDVAKITGEITDFVPPLYSHHNRNHQLASRSIR